MTWVDIKVSSDTKQTIRLLALLRDETPAATVENIIANEVTRLLNEHEKRDRDRDEDFGDIVWPEGKYPLRSVSAEKNVSKERYDETKGEMAGGDVYIEVEWEFLAGPPRGTLIVAELSVEEAQKLAGSRKLASSQSQLELVGLKVWASVVTERQEDRGQVRHRSVIAAGSYEPIDAYPLPPAADELIVDC